MYGYFISEKANVLLMFGLFAANEISLHLQLTCVLNLVVADDSLVSMFIILCMMLTFGLFILDVCNFCCLLQNACFTLCFSS